MRDERAASKAIHAMQRSHRLHATQHAASSMQHNHGRDRIGASMHKREALHGKCGRILAQMCAGLTFAVSSSMPN
jgi:hypothetical protein